MEHEWEGCSFSLTLHRWRVTDDTGEFNALGTRL